jgi:hypothetical protein
MSEIEEIEINERTTNQLVEMSRQIQTLSNYMEIIASTLINASNAPGIYVFSPDYKKLIRNTKNK